MPSDLTLKCPVRLAPTAQVDQSVRFLLTDAQLAGVEEIRPVIVESGVIIRAMSIVYSGAHLTESCTIDHFCVIRQNVWIGRFSRVMNYTEVGSDCRIGSESRVGGMLCNRAVVGNRTTTFARLIHSYQSHGSGQLEPSPELGDDVIVGQDAILVGGISIGDGARIGAGAIVIESVPARTRVLAPMDFPIRMRR